MAAASVLAMLLPGVASAAQVPGIQTHLLWPGVTDAAMDRQLDLVAGAGAHVTRVDLGWASLQQVGPNRYETWYLDRIDRLVREANTRGIKPLFSVMSSPCWASGAPETLKQSCAGAWWQRGVQNYAPTDPAAYGRATAFLAARYGDKVAGWELWNEPNHADFFKADDQALRYAELVKATYPLIKAADPSAVVVAGAVSESDLAFINRLFDLGISGSFDAFSIHPYSHDRSPLETGPDVRTSFIRGVPAVRAVMLLRGNSKPVWLTESGWSTSSVRSEPWLSGVSEADQARYLEEQYDQIRSWDYVAVNIWFNLQDTSSDPADLVGNYGLLRPDGSEKPAYAAFRRAADRLAGAAAPQTPVPAPAPGVSPTPVPATSPVLSATPVPTPAADVSPRPAPAPVPDAFPPSLPVPVPAPGVVLPSPVPAPTAVRQDPAAPPLSVSMFRHGKRIVIQGHATRGAVVRLRVRAAGTRRLSRTYRVRAQATGGYSRVLPRALSNSKGLVVVAAVMGAGETRTASARFLG